GPVLAAFAMALAGKVARMLSTAICQSSVKILDLLKIEGKH
ncbi:MAG: hypothetical protein ACJA2P_001573, partial [Rhodoferax sp.]